MLVQIVGIIFFPDQFFLNPTIFWFGWGIYPQPPLDWPYPIFLLTPLNFSATFFFWPTFLTKDFFTQKFFKTKSFKLLFSLTQIFHQNFLVPNFGNHNFWKNLFAKNAWPDSYLTKLLGQEFCFEQKSFSYIKLF